MILRKGLLGAFGIILASGSIALAQDTQTQTPASPDGSQREQRMEQRSERMRERLGRREGGEGMRHGMRHQRRAEFGRRAMGHLGHELNLSEAQREQGRTIMRRRLENTKGQREELFRLREKRIAGTFSAEDEARGKALRQEIRASMEGVRAEMQGLLTAEQKAKLDGLKAERKTRHEQRMKEREQRMQERQQRLKETPR